MFFYFRLILDISSGFLLHISLYRFVLVGVIVFIKYDRNSVLNGYKIGIKGILVWGKDVKSTYK